MTIQPTFFDWVKSGLDWSKFPYESCSPNLLLLANKEGTGYLQRRWGVGQYLGCEGNREIRLGGTQSEHSWGAATDWRYPAGTADAILTFLIDNSKELGVCAIHDYLRCRIWRAGRTPVSNDAHGSWWKAQVPNPGNGMGQSWANYFHIVTTKDAFFWSIPIEQRINPTQPPQEEDMPKTQKLINYDSGRVYPPGHWAGGGTPVVTTVFIDGAVISHVFSGEITADYQADEVPLYPWDRQRLMDKIKSGRTLNMSPFDSVAPNGESPNQAADLELDAAWKVARG